MPAFILEQNLDEAVGQHQAGNLAEARLLYQQILEQQPDHSDALHLLGVIAFQEGRADEAMDLLRRAIVVKPTAEYCANLALVLSSMGDHDEAIATYQQAISLRGDLPVLHVGLSKALKQRGRLDEAIAALNRALELWPDYPKAHLQLADCLRQVGRSDEAIAAYRKVLAIRPDQAEAYRDLATLYHDNGQLDEAILAFSKAVELRPNVPEARNNLGNALLDAGQLDQALGCYDRALALQPAFATAHSNRVYALNFHPGYDARSISHELAEWERRHARPVAGEARPHANDPSPNRRLRIGYVSPDFRKHVVGRNLLPLLRNHDHRRFEIFCYSNVAQPDVETARTQTLADQWRTITSLSDDAAAQLIRDDQIDVLVDLTLHMARHRLLVFARKPAPVQVTYLGYCGSTGLRAIDYRLSDPIMDPPDSDVSAYSEQTIRLPRCYWCYQPWEESVPVSMLPADERGYVTFGCLNNFTKVSTATMDAWAKILAAVPQSRLIIHSQLSGNLDPIFSRFASAGIAPQRLEFVGQQTLPHYLQTYQRIDIALDPFPHGGGITTCDALWMGAPVVTLSGPTAVGRGGQSILSNIGLEQYVTHSIDQYMANAAAFASDLPALRQLRRSLRDRMLDSPLMDASRFARDVENAYRSMWRSWCQGRPIPTPESAGI